MVPRDKLFRSTEAFLILFIFFCFVLQTTELTGHIVDFHPRCVHHVP